MLMSVCQNTMFGCVETEQSARNALSLNTILMVFYAWYRGFFAE